MRGEQPAHDTGTAHGVEDNTTRNKYEDAAEDYRRAARRAHDLVDLRRGGRALNGLLKLLRGSSGGVLGGLDGFNNRRRSRESVNLREKNAFSFVRCQLLHGRKHASRL